MKHIKISIVAAALLFAGAITVKAQTADEIINKHIAAIGGADNWKKVKTVNMVGSINSGGMEIPVSIITVNGKAMKVEFTVNGMTGYQILTTTEGWSYSPFQGQSKPEALTAEVVKDQQDQLDVQGELMDYKAKGNKVEYLGKDDVDGTECFKLKVTMASGKEENVFIDAATYYHIRTVAKAKVDGKEIEATSNLSNFQKLPEGIVFPMSMESGNGPINFKTVEINKPVDDKIFKPTASK